MEISKILQEFSLNASSPTQNIKKYHDLNKKVVGVLPYYVPEEILYACDIIPFGLWGADIPVKKAKEYFPAFFCGMIQTEMEMILSPRLDSLDGILLTGICDSLKAFALNAQAARKDLTFITFNQSLNRNSNSALDFTLKTYDKLINDLTDKLSITYSEEKLKEAISIYNENRKLLKEFSLLCRNYPKTITPKIRADIFKAGYFMDRKEHNILLKELIDELSSLPIEKQRGKKVITSGILADNKEILSIMEENKISIICDDVAYESRNILDECKEESLTGLAKRYLSIKACSILDRGGKERVERLAYLSDKYNADGVIIFLTKFCDPEEYDVPRIKKVLEDEYGIPTLVIEVDKSISNSGQSKTILQAFAES